MADQQQQILGNYQISSGTIQRGLLDIITPNQSVISKVSAGNGIFLTSSGVDQGTGNVIISGSQPFLPFGVYQNLSPMSTTSFPYGITISKTITLLRWVQHVFIATTNDSGNYWIIELRRISDAANIATIQTNGVAANTQLLLSTTSFSNQPLVPSNISLYIICTKSGSPGNLYMTGPAVNYTE